MADVSKKCPARLQGRGRFNGLLDCGMGGMRFVPKRIEKEHVESAKEVHGGIRDTAVIGQVGDVAEAESEDGGVAVANGDRSELNAQDIEGRAVKFVEFELRNISGAVGAIEDVR